jgi:hypothetical protein
MTVSKKAMALAIIVAFKPTPIEAGARDRPIIPDTRNAVPVRTKVDTTTILRIVGLRADLSSHDRRIRTRSHENAGDLQDGNRAPEYYVGE